MKEQKEDPKKQTRFLILLFVVIIPLVTIVAFFGFMKVRAMKAKQDSTNGAAQESFAGTPEVSGQLQADCQKSAEKIVRSKETDAMIKEFQQNVENCKEVYFSLQEATSFRNEGTYPDLVVDIANAIYSKDPKKAIALLQATKNLTTWDFYMGPIVCDSQKVVDAYLDSYALSPDKVCLKEDTFKATVMGDLKNRKFDFITKTLSNTRVVFVSQPESDIGCPEKISEIIKLLQKLTNAQMSLDEGHAGDGTLLSFAYRQKDEDKVILDFKKVNDCIQLKSVLVPGLQGND